jgi:hypothetical protein
MGFAEYEPWLYDIRLSRRDYAGLMQVISSYVLPVSWDF